jgi:hypothetical protein
MKRRYPLAPLLTPLVVGAVMAASLIAILLVEGVGELPALAALAGVVGFVGWKLARPQRRRG